MGQITFCKNLGESERELSRREIALLSNWERRGAEDPSLQAGDG